MHERRSAAVAAVATVLIVALAQAQTPPDEPAAWTPRLTADGVPDLQGKWVNFDSTPFESDTTGPLNTIPNVNPPAHWADHDSPMSPKRRSMVVDPPDGRVPVQKWAEDKRDYDLAHLEDHYKHETAWVRCITRGVPGGMFPAGYNNGYEIMQIPGYVIIVYEMIHDTRIIPLDGRPHVGANIRLWNGDPRGHFEGNTLVVETTNFREPNRGASEKLKLIERFKPVAANKVEWSVTYDDASTWTRPWTFAMVLTKDPTQAPFEYACHEGNYGLANILSAARAEEKTAK